MMLLFASAALLICFDRRAMVLVSLADSLDDVTSLPRWRRRYSNSTIATAGASVSFTH